MQEEYKGGHGSPNEQGPDFYQRSRQRGSRRSDEEAPGTAQNKLVSKRIDDPTYGKPPAAQRPQAAPVGADRDETRSSQNAGGLSINGRIPVFDERNKKKGMPGSGSFGDCPPTQQTYTDKNQTAFSKAANGSNPISQAKSPLTPVKAKAQGYADQDSKMAFQHQYDGIDPAQKRIMNNILAPLKSDHLKSENLRTDADRSRGKRVAQGNAALDTSGYLGRRDGQMAAQSKSPRSSPSQYSARDSDYSRRQIVPMEIEGNEGQKEQPEGSGSGGGMSLLRQTNMTIRSQPKVQSEQRRAHATGGILQGDANAQANVVQSSPLFAATSGISVQSGSQGSRNPASNSNEEGDRFDGDDDKPLLIKQGLRGLQLNFEKERKMYEQTVYSMMCTILNYIKSDIRKKTRSFRLGVTTIFIVVSFITMLKSIIDVAPIAFLKVGQDQAGAFDFTIMSDYSSKLNDGDVNLYNLTDLFEEQPEEEEEGEKLSLLDRFSQTTLEDQGDHAEIFGFSLIKFDAYKEQLDALNSTGMFRGFSPRWQLPTKIRNISNPATNTSNILIIIDSAREIDNRIGQHFSNEVIGDSEIIVSAYALRHLDVKPDRKHKVELYFDVIGLMNLFTTTTGESARTQGEEGGAEDVEQINNDLNNALNELLPTTDQMINILRDSYNLEITEDNQIQINLKEILENNFNLTDYNVTIPTFNLLEVLPMLDPKTLEDINITSIDGVDNLSLKDLLDGSLELNLAQILALVDGTNVTSIDIPVEQALDAILNYQNIPTHFSHEMTVIDDFESTNGKFGDTLGNVALIDCHYANRLILNTYNKYVENLLEEQPFYYVFLQYIDKTLKAGIDRVDFCNYALQVQGVLDNQVDAYTGTSANMNQLLGQGGNLINDALGYDANVTISTPLKNQMTSVELVSTFMDSIMITIIAFLCILSTKLIYSLMLSDVEEKTYEFGMLRALGFNTRNVKVTISLQSIFFAVPGLVFGLVMASALNLALRYFLYSLTKNTNSYGLSNGSVYIGIAIGLGMPMISNYFPIQKALGQNLRQSLDMYRRSVDGQLSMTQKKLQDYGLSPPQFVLAIMFVVLGILTYYVAPSAFLFKNFGVFFLIINGLLIMMVLGLTFLSILILPYVQKFLVNLFLVLMPQDRKLKVLIYKSMVSNKKRNTNTAIMFALCLSFLIFAGSAFELFGMLISSTLESQIGTDLYGVCIDYEGLNEFIDEGPITEFLQEQKDLDGSVEGWSLTSPSLKHLLNKFAPADKRETFFSDFAGYKQVTTNIYAIQENFLEITKSKFYMPTELEPGLVDEMEFNDQEVRLMSSGQVDAVKLLYSDLYTGERFNKPDQYEVLTSNYNYGYDGRKYNAETRQWEEHNQYLQELKVLIPEGFRDHLSLDTDRSARMCIGKQQAQTQNFCESTYRVKIRGMVTKMPGWLFTSYQAAQFFSQQLITEQQMKELLDDFFDKNEDAIEKYNSTIADYDFQNGIPKYKLFVKLAPNITNDRREYIANGIRSYFKGDGTVLIDLAFAMTSIEASVLLFKIFVGVIGVIALTLAFFLLLVSTTQNVKDNVWEYGCLRAMGLTQKQGMKMFMIEQYSLILSSLFLGTTCGLLLACVVTAQFFLFLEFKFELVFQQEIVLIMYLTALATTFYAVYTPVSAVNRQKVAQTIKGVAA